MKEKFLFKVSDSKFSYEEKWSVEAVENYDLCITFSELKLHKYKNHFIQSIVFDFINSNRCPPWFAAKASIDNVKVSLTKIK